MDWEDLKIEIKYKSYRRNIGENLYNTGFDNDFFDTKLKRQIIKLKTDKMTTKIFLIL